MHYFEARFPGVGALEGRHSRDNPAEYLLSITTQASPPGHTLVMTMLQQYGVGREVLTLSAC